MRRAFARDGEVFQLKLTYMMSGYLKINGIEVPIMAVMAKVINAVQESSRKVGPGPAVNMERKLNNFLKKKIR